MNLPSGWTADDLLRQYERDIRAAQIEWLAANRRASFARSEGERMRALTDRRRAQMSLDRLHTDAAELSQEITEANHLNRRARLALVGAA